MTSGPAEAEPTRLLTEITPDGVMILTFHGPHQRNAAGAEVMPALRAAVTRAGEDDTVRAVVLTGSEGYFSAGGNVRKMKLGGHPESKGVFSPTGAGLVRGQEVLDRLHRLPKPTIAAVEGCAVGIGWSFVLACDLTVAAEDSFFMAPHVRLGLVADGGCAWFLTQALGSRRATQLLTLGERLPASRAAELGLVNQVTAPGAALKEALDWAGRLATGPQDALRLTKHLVRAAERTPAFRDFLDTELVTVNLALHGPDAHEGLAAHLDRREADFGHAR
ncbi:enoyl-CoA hydratase/isomerase family protein [Streptomyces albipurpureus]|uniref:Enoyl-CoA hydratase-related protein n=1 Tax=Streptomyces albipurpureus TaxID=2897419 RepID=A0ABT0UXW9_9ACTN|nr:enoyl-CoA hydratase-related protein [Streptomyces sp. CWNU-1]MCM2393423.1 enoyl-CoA hydratase-related protein [Streptomyces sp. CWNU-1]